MFNAGAMPSPNWWLSKRSRRTQLARHAAQEIETTGLARLETSLSDLVGYGDRRGHEHDRLSHIEAMVRHVLHVGGTALSAIALRWTNRLPSLSCYLASMPNRSFLQPTNRSAKLNALPKSHRRMYYCARCRCTAARPCTDRDWRL